MLCRYLALNTEGEIVLFEVKNGAKAPFTKPQKLIYRGLPLRGGTITSGKLERFGIPYGTKIPTDVSVRIIRYE